MASQVEAEPLTEEGKKSGEEPKKKVSHVEVIIMILTLIFWATVLFFGLWTLKFELFENSELFGFFQWIHGLAYGLLLTVLSLVGAYVAAREHFLNVHKMSMRIATCVMEVFLIFAAGAGICDGPWNKYGQFYNPGLTFLGRMMFFVGLVCAVGAVISEFGKKFLRK